MPSSLGLALLLAASSAAAEETDRGRDVVERVLAVVDERPLLLSEVRAVEAVRGLGRAHALEASIDERLMHEEAARLPQAAVSDADADRALEALLASRPALEDRVPRAELRRLIRRQAAILRYVEFRFRPQVRIREEELRAAWNEDYRGKPEGPPFEEAAPTLRARLERRALDERIEEWVRNLRSRAEIRYVEGPGSPPPDSSLESPADP
jgi:hypothetical protein